MSTPRPAVTKRGPGRRDRRLTLRHNPIGLLFSTAVWRSAGYLLSYVLVSGVIFAIVLAGVMVPVALSITVVAVPLLAAAASVVRACAQAERVRLRLVFAEPVRGYYRAPDGSGLWRRARARWGEVTTWRDLSYLVGLWPVLVTLDAVALGIWLCCLAGMALPLWYARVPGVCMGVCGTDASGSGAGHGLMIGYYPHGIHGAAHHGLLVDTLPAALVTAAGFAAAFLLFNYVLVAAARLHAQVARALLRPPADPLAPARAVLAGPGLLGPLTRTSPPLAGQPLGSSRTEDRSLS